MKVLNTGILVAKPLSCTKDASFSLDVAITGDLDVTGTKNFLIAHPTNSAKQIKHACVESSKPLNCYRFAHIPMKNGTNFVDLPSYFKLINANPSVQCSPVNTFCQWYASVDLENNRVKVVVSKEVSMDVLVMADRNDKAAQGYKDVIDKIEKPDED